MTDFPFRACAGNVLLRRVKQDGKLIWLQGIDPRLLQIAEVVGISERWPQWRAWCPPLVVPRRGEMLDGTQEPDWKPPEDLNYAPKPVGWGPDAEARINDIKVGDLVVFAQSRVYTTFKWGDADILVYPGNWLYGVVEEHHLVEHPELRRYEYEPV